MGFVGEYAGAKRQFEDVFKIDKVHWPEQMAKDCATVWWYCQGNHEEALKCCEEALAVAENLGDPRLEGWCLVDLGTVYLDMPEQREQGLKYFEQAREIFRWINDRHSEAHALYCLGDAYERLNHYGKAVDSLEEALSEFRKRKGHRQIECDAFNLLGALYCKLGQPDKALGCLTKALEIRPQCGPTMFFPIVPFPELERLAHCDYNLAGAYELLGEHTKAIRYYRRARPLHWVFRSANGIGWCDSRIGWAYERLGNHKRALQYYQKALGWQRKYHGREGEGNTLFSLSCTYTAMKQQDRALQCCHEALAILREVRDQPGEADTLDELMRIWSEGKPNLAVFYGKQAVNTYQEIRGSIAEMDREFQKGYLKSHESTYRTLADILITMNRLPEAEQVLNLLKEEELFDFQRRESSDAPTASEPLEFTPTEAGWAEGFRKIGDRLSALGVEHRTLADKKHRSQEDDQRLEAVKKEIEVAEADFHKMLNRLEADASTPEALKARLRDVKEANALKATLAELGEGTVAIYTLVGETKYRVILVTSNSFAAGEYDIPAVALCQKVEEFRAALQNPDSNPVPLARSLYNILIGPIKESLGAAQAQTLMWSLDGPLRYLPIAALHDGEGYLVERCKNVVLTQADLTQLKRAVSHAWTGLGLGVSTSYPGFPALAGVREELDRIIADKRERVAGAVMPGTIEMNTNFTAETMLKALQEKHPLVHIASHFKLSPGNEKDSFLLLGDGHHLSLAEVNALPDVFAGVELLTLSACNTAVGGTPRSGVEVDSFGEIAQKKGANAVMATLWSVRDVSTSALMEKFYRLRQAGPGKTKAEALQEAQLEMMGKSTKPESGERRATTVGGTGEEKPDSAVFELDPRWPFAHPHFWAPFVLMGNWR